MGLLSKFENKMEDGIEGAAGMVGRSSLTPVQITKKAEKQMRREKIVGAGKQYAPTLYTVLVSPDDDSKLFKYYPTLAGEVETFLMARASELGYMMDGAPLVRFISDPELKRGKFDVVAEMVAASIVEQLRDDEMRRYGLPTGGAGRRRGPAGAMAAQRARSNLKPSMQPLVNLQPSEEEAGLGRGEPAADRYAQAPYENAGAPDAFGGVQAQPQRQAQQSLYDGQQGGMPAQPSMQGMPQQDPRGYAQGMPQVPGVGAAGGGVAGGGAGAAGVGAAGAGAAGMAVGQGMPASYNQAQQAQQFQQPGAQAHQHLPHGGAEQPFGDEGFAEQVPGSVRTADLVDDPQAASYKSALDVYLYDEARDRVYTLTGAPQRIGRESANDLVVPDINISRVHAEIHREADGSWVIKDLGSTNGLYINGRKVDSARLRDADMITLGTTTLEFQKLS